ncbi:MAG TPA: response regulator transcription factor [Rhizobiales bacterium]|nr:response regulator transcription factor [Hyphomicrobiales bacterium]
MASYAAGDDVNFGQVLVVGRSPVNCVVVAKIVERSGLRSVSQVPEKAIELLYSLRPGTVVLDGGPTNGDCDEVLARIDAQRRATGRKVPAVILLSTREMLSEDVLGFSIDAVVAKPFTPDTLQPVVEGLLRRIRG